MSFTDKTLQCVDCGADFVFTAEEQEFFASKGYTNEPKRCLTCRRNRRVSRPEGGDGYQNRQMYAATCAQCGKDCEVPFEPRDGRPVYCSDCFSRLREG
ncbi:MAG: zinc-ribbon domain containing protein [Dehalococcoidia bacterium]|nr:zinc-ribbon domain containing protein [Dehalococcoidia bacterium]